MYIYWKSAKSSSVASYYDSTINKAQWGYSPDKSYILWTHFKQ